MRGNIAQVALVGLTVLLLVAIAEPTRAEDADGNWFNDDYEQALVDKFCPSLILQAGDRGVSPEPVEIVTNHIWGSLFSTTGYEGELYFSALAATDYSGLDNNAPPKITYLGFTTNCGYPPTGWPTYHFDYGGRGYFCAYESEDTNDQPTEPQGDDWYTVYKNGNSWTQAGSAFPNTVYAHPFTFLENSVRKYVIQYWFFYPFNDWVNNHEGDWEHINVVLTTDDPQTAVIEKVNYYFHEAYSVATRSQAEYPQGPFDYYVDDGTHPVVFVGGFWTAVYHYGPGVESSGSGHGSHGSYPMPGFWEGVQDLPSPLGSLHDRVDADGLWIPWSEVVDNDDTDLDGVVLLKEPIRYSHPKMNWLRANILWGRPKVFSVGSNHNRAEGNTAPRGPAHQGTWNNPYGGGSPFEEFAGIPPHTSADLAGWSPPPPLTITWPIQNAVVSDVVDINGWLHVADSVRIDVGAGPSPLSWTADGAAVTATPAPILDANIGSWNTGVVPAGEYTLRVRVYEGGDTFDDFRTVSVSHKSVGVGDTGQPFTSIQPAINFAEMGDTLRVEGGSYNESIQLRETLQLIGIDNPEITGTLNTNAVSAIDLPYAATIDGFTIRSQSDGEFPSAGIRGVNSDIVVRNCTVRDNTRAGVLLEGGRAEFSDCAFTNNGGGTQITRVVAVDDAVFTRCSFVGNLACDVGAIVSVEGDGVFVDCVLVDNFSQCSPWIGVVRVGDGAAVTIDECTIANNRNNDPIYPDDGPAIGVEMVGPTSAAEIRNSIISHNSGRAVCGDPGASVTFVTSNLFGNGYSVEGVPETGICLSDLAWSQQFTTDVVNMDPSFCDAASADYTLQAYSPAAPGVSFPAGAGSFGVGCTPPALLSLDPDSLQDGQSVLFGCPLGDTYDLLLTVDLDDSITRDLGSNELALDFSESAFRVFDDDGVINTLDPVVGPDFVGEIVHGQFGGHSIDSVAVLMNGALLDRFDLDVRSPDIDGDGYVGLSDLALFGPVYIGTNPYVSYMDFNADGQIQLIDMSYFGPHWQHQASNPQANSPRQVQQTGFEVALNITELVNGPLERELHVQVRLDNISTFRVACLSFSNETQGLQFREYVPEPSWEAGTMLAPIVRNGSPELFLAAMAAKSFVGPTAVLGTIVFDITTPDAINITEADFALQIGDVMLAGGAQGVFAGASINHAPTKEILVTNLAQNYPNPFNPQTTIAYSLAFREQVTLRVYGVDGSLVRTLVNEVQAPDRYQVRWDGRNDQGAGIASGVYFYRLTAGPFEETRKMVLLR